MLGSLLVSPHPASPELLDEELLDAPPPVPLLDEELLDEELLDEELLDEELLAGAPPAPPLAEELPDVDASEPPPPPAPPARFVWMELAQDEDAAERALSRGMIPWSNAGRANVKRPDRRVGVALVRRMC